MSELRSIGLKLIEIGDPAADGDMGTGLAAIGGTLQDTCDITTSDPSPTEIFVEENSNAVEVLYSPTVDTLKFTVIDMTPAILVQIFGGTVTGVGDAAMWKAPVSMPIIEKSIRITTMRGIVISIPRGSLTTKKNWTFRKKDVLKNEISVRVLLPNKAGIEPMTVGKVQP